MSTSSPRVTCGKCGAVFDAQRIRPKHRLLCGDSTQPEDVARVLDGERAELCFTSPPYADQRTYLGDADLSPAHLARFLTASAESVGVFALNLGIVRRGGFVHRYWDAYITEAERAGLGLLSWNVWSREGMPMSVGQVTAIFPIQHEWILVFGADSRVRLRPTIPNKESGAVAAPVDRQADGRLVHKRPVQVRECRELGTVITLPSVSANTDRPAQFPVALAVAYIQSFSGDTYDPFCGSGTTIIACEQLQRRCFAIEIAPPYVQVAIDRWQAFTGRAPRRVSQ